MTTLATNKPGHYSAGTVEISPPARSGESGVRRIGLSADSLVTQPAKGIETIVDVLDHSVATFGNREAMGWRDVVDIHEEQKEVKKLVDGVEVTEKKTWKYFQLSDYRFYSYIEFKAITTEIARALVHLGVASNEVFNIYSETCVNWQLMAHGCSTVSVTIATAYDTLGEEGLAHSLNQPQCVGIFTNADLFPTLARVLSNTPSVKFVVYDGTATPANLDKIRSVRSDVQFFALTQFRDLGKSQPMSIIDGRRPTADNLACIMYTSGSTGSPKGVCLKHSSVVAAVGGFKDLIGHHLGSTDYYLAYLPLAHVFEYIAEAVMLFMGVRIGYGRVKTLTDASVRNCKGDIAAFRPTILFGVPAIWETLRKGILGKVHAAGGIKEILFNAAVAVKRNNIPFLGRLADAIVFSGVKAGTGGRLRLGLSGGAAISKETQEFLNWSLVRLIAGYGMTESTGLVAITPPEIEEVQAVGFPAPSIEIKLLDVPELGYLSTGPIQQGEVCLRGGSVITEYYKRPDLNADTTIFAEDGWFRTGDIGQWNAHGTLSLIDRVKNLVKLANGEYIALERLETTYKACNLLANICVYASADARQPIAIVIPHELHLRKALMSNSEVDSSQDLADLCKERAVAELILKHCNALGKSNGFKSMELLQNVVLTPDEWTPLSGLVTAAQKVQRHKIAEVFANEIKAAYGVTGMDGKEGSK